MSKIKLCIYPDFAGPDKGDGGIRRVVEAQQRYLPDMGFEIVTGTLDEQVAQADIVAFHGGMFHPVHGKPVVSHNHGMYWTPEYEWSKWAFELNNKVIHSMRSADITTAPSEWVARILSRGMWLNTPVLYHGINPEDWEPAPLAERGDYVLWNKTRTDPICETETLDTLSKMAPDVQFVTTFGPTINNVTHTGRLPFEAAKKYIQGAAVYLCNTRETFGIGTLEAMACEVPILGWNWGGQREIVEHKKHGWLATPGDFDSLLEGLRFCLKNRAELGKAAREHVLRNFTWKAAIQRYAILYKELYKQSQVVRPKVSVIITCYNLAQYLERAVQSVLSQSMSDFEIIIVNDASPDNTQEIANKLALRDKRVRVVTNKTNLYLAGALNAGISVAKGKYIVPLDADNELGPNALALLSEPLDNGWYDPSNGRRHRVDITYGSMEVVEEDESGGNKRFISDWPPTNFDYKSQMQHRNQISSTAMYRRSIWQRIGGYRRRCRTAEDADFWCRATSFGAMPHKVTEAVTLIYHNRSDSMSHVVKDWAWHEWYTFGGNVPFAAALPPQEKPIVQTHEPARITVVIPVGPNHTEIVVDAVDSIVNQTYDKWDVIVVNDSGKPLPWIHPFVKVVNTAQAGSGPAIARNLGISHCKSPLFLLLDADDYLQPEALALMLSAWEPGTYIYTDWVIQETGEVHQTENYRCEDVLKKLPHAVTCLYERAAWVTVGGFDEKIKAWEDWDFIFALNAAGFCGKRLPIPVLQYRMRTGTVREEKWEQRDILKVEIQTKWKKYYDGEPLMACGCKKANSAPVVAVPQQPQQQQQVASGANGSIATASATATAPQGMVQVMYVGTQAGARTYRGPKTGTEYRFSNQPGNNIKYVFQQDAQIFAERHEFKLVVTGPTGTAELVQARGQLQASGPPR